MDDLEDSLNDTRLNFVTTYLKQLGVESVLDLGCGKGALLEHLISIPQFKCIVGVDISLEALAQARLTLETYKSLIQNRVQLLHASFTENHEELKEFDAATLVETIEHIDPNRLSLVEKAVFTYFKPRFIILTTPNHEFNTVHGRPAGRFRHPDHRFEWGRYKFQSWAKGVAVRNKYNVSFEGIGDPDLRAGHPTQVAIFESL